MLLELGIAGVLSQWNINFYRNIRSKRKLSDKQLKRKYRIIEAAKHYVNETQKENKR